MADPEWERGVIERLASEGLKEQRRARRWGIFFKFLTFAYLTIFLLAVSDWKPDTELPDGSGHTALIDVDGVIEADGNVSADNITDSLQQAFKDQSTKGVILRINSPGGSPVQSGIIYDEIRRQRGLHPDIKVYAVVEDLCASGGYYIASAADEIYVDKASLVGSIGVIMDQFGFVGSLDKLGVERRVLTSGENKAFLDPFSPLKPEHAAHAKQMLAEIHQQFIDVVKKGRGGRLKESPELFSGLFWTGAKSIELGLADHFGNVESVARDVIKAENIIDYTQKESLAERFAKRFGTTMAEALSGVLTKQGISLR
ncbi:MAG TPA: S49 family peptidase [Burkholderiales bacterium]|nr:S49 family peptidase [Burkholderiales bacterium]